MRLLTLSIRTPGARRLDRPDVERQPRASATGAVRGGRADQPDPVRVSDDPDHRGDRGRTVGRGPDRFQAAPRPPDLHLRGGARGGLLGAPRLRRTDRDAVREREHDPVAVLRDGQRAPPGRPRDARRDTDPTSGGYHAASGNDGDGRAVLRRVRDGGDVRTGRGPLFRTGDGGGADLGDGDEERRARLPLPADVLAGDVDATRCCRALERVVGAITARWCVDGDGEKGLRDRHDRRSAILPDQDGATADMRFGLRGVALLLALMAGSGAWEVASAQDGGLDLGTVAPGAAVQTLDGKPTD